VRTSIAQFFAGEALALVGIGWWSPQAALVLAGLQLIAYAMLRQINATAKKPVKRSTGLSRAGLHRRRASIRRFVDRGRARLRPVREATS